MTSEYKNNKSVAKNPTISIDVDDPRVSWENLKQTQSRIGSEIEIIGSEGRQVLFGGSFSPIKNDKNIIEEKVIQVPGVPVPGTPPLPVTNLVAEWGPGDSLILTFDFDTTDDLNLYIDRFLIKLYDPVNDEYHLMRAGVGYFGSTFLNYTSVSQELILSNSEIVSAINPSTYSNLSKVAVATADILSIGEYVEADIPDFVSLLPVPVFTLTAGIDHYVVTIDPANIADALTKGFFGVVVEEKVTTEMVQANVSLTEGWVQATALSQSSTQVVYTPDGLNRWVRLKYINVGSAPSLYSIIQRVTPLPFLPINTDPPTQFTSASIAWSGNDILVTFAQPAENAGTTVKVKLVPYVNGVESTSLYAHFYHQIVPPETSFKILSLDMYGQFGTYYSQFKAYITSLSAQGVETTSSVIISGPIQRTNALSNIFPTLGTPNVNNPTGIFRVTPSVSGYIVDFDVPAGATRLEVYEKSTPWTAIPTNDNLVVYSGLSPASIPSEDNSTRYVIVRYYDQYDNYSRYSMEKVGQTAGVEVIPIDVGMDSLIEFPIKISTNGSIFAGAGDHTVNPKVFFNTAGLFAYDAGGVATTQIINDALANTPTFITQNARIAQWSIDKQLFGTAPNQTTVNYIQNNLYATTQNKNYTGISSNGTYSFWAGAESSLNTDGLAKFSVKPTGEVVASKITINGDGTGGDLIRAGGSAFIVTQAGAITARSAIIKGTIEVDGQSYFDANVNIRNGYLIAGANGPGVGPNMQIAADGLKAINSDEVATTKIYSGSTGSVTFFDTVSNASKTVSGITLWSQKALFGPTESSGWLIDSGLIQANNITLNSTAKTITIRAESDANAGILLSATSSTGIALAVGNVGSPSTANFRVTSAGDMFARNAIIQGTVRANDGGFGTVVNDAITVGWTVGAAGLTAQGSGRINLSSGGAITVGDYSITSSGTNFVITQVSNGLNLMKTESLSGVTEDPLRLFLGDTTRQVEVAKSAQVSGAGTNLQFGSDTTTNNAYRSGGLRNMYTVATGAAGSAIYPSAVKGDILLVYNPNLGL